MRLRANAAGANFTPQKVPCPHATLNHISRQMKSRAARIPKASHSSSVPMKVYAGLRASFSTLPSQRRTLPSRILALHSVSPLHDDEAQ